MKKLLKSISVSGALLFASLQLCGCGTDTPIISLEKSRVPVNYTATYHITVKDGIDEGEDLEYDNSYSVALEEEDAVQNLVISSVAEAPFKKDEDSEEGVQRITATSRLIYDETDSFGMPLTVEEEFTNSIIEKQYTYLLAEHDHNLQMALLRTKKYKSTSDAELTENLYSVSLEKQYFDKDSLPFLLAAFPQEQNAVLWLSAGNRDRLQAVRYEPLGQESITVAAGTFLCNKIQLRPNTDFSVYSAVIYIDTVTGIPVKIIHLNSVMELTQTDI